MKIKQIVIEDFVNYKTPSLFIGIGTCDFKCCREGGFDKSVCQNSELSLAKPIELSEDEVFELFYNNSITKSIVVGGMEPMLQFDDVLSLLKYFREHDCDADFVIYTGYYRNEIEDKVQELAKYKNVIVKFGRYVPNQEKHYDEVLGVWLASDNQYAERIS